MKAIVLQEDKEGRDEIRVTEKYITIKRWCRERRKGREGRC